MTEEQVWSAVNSGAVAYSEYLRLVKMVVTDYVDHLH